MQGDVAATAAALPFVLRFFGSSSQDLAAHLLAVTEIKMFTQPNANDVLAFRPLCPSASNIILQVTWLRRHLRPCSFYTEI